MNKPEPDESLEKLLDEMRPAGAPPALLKRIEDSVSATTTPEPVPVGQGPSVWLMLLRRIALPVCATAVVCVAFFLPENPTTHPELKKALNKTTNEEGNPLAMVYSPVETNSVLLDSEELGIITGPDELPVRLMRVRWLDYSRSRAADGSELYLSDTREQIVPVSLTFN
jgi:hypothetical protein